MVDFVSYELDDGTKVYFEAAESGLTSLRGGSPAVEEAGPLRDRLTGIALAAGEISEEIRDKLHPTGLELTFGIKLSGGVHWWWFGRADGEATIQVKATWQSPTSKPAAAPGDDES